MRNTSLAEDYGKRITGKSLQQLKKAKIPVTGSWPKFEVFSSDSLNVIAIPS
jgi:hypothetical protein